MDESRLRDSLRRLAEEADTPEQYPSITVSKARRRIGRNVVASALLMSALVGGALSMAQIDEEPLPRPVGPSPEPSSSPSNPPTPSKQPFARIDGRVAFLSDKGPGQSLNIVIASGSTFEIVTDVSSSGSRLSWSPNGRQIVFDRGLGPGQGSLVILDVASGDEQVLMADEPSETPGLTPQGPAWSPDGERIAFSSGAGEIYVRDVSAGKPGLLVSPPGRTCGYGYPAWSPDGTAIAFSNGCAGGGITIAPADGGPADGASQRRVTDERRDLEPSWSPDGSKIAFTRFGPEGNQIVVVDIASGKESVLTEETDSYTPSWSPDGTLIVFGSNRTGHQNIWVMNSDGSDELPVTLGRGLAIAPAWAPR